MPSSPESGVIIDDRKLFECRGDTLARICLNIRFDHGEASAGQFIRKGNMGNGWSRTSQ